MDLIVVVVLAVVRLIPTGDVVEFGGGDLASAGQAKPNFEGARRAKTARECYCCVPMRALGLR